MELLDSNELQYCYTKFYVEMRRYMWDASIVELLVDFEMAVYQAIPDITEIRKCWYKLKQAIAPVLKEDPDFNVRAKKLDKLIQSDAMFCKLYLTKEVPTA